MANLLNPPFSRILDDYQRYVISIEFPIYICCGMDAWQDAKRNLAIGCISLCLPYGHSVTSYKWSIKGLNIVVMDSGGLTEPALLAICSHLLKCGAQSVVLCSDLMPTEVFG